MAAIAQILAASYPHVVAEKRKPANQWSESALLSHLEKLGAIKRVGLGATIETPLDYRRAVSAQILATDVTATSLTKSDVVAGASYAVASISVDIVWTKEDEAKNSEPAQKVDLVDSLISNALESHDDLLEATLFTTSGALIGFSTLITEDGTGTIGGIVAGTDTWWKNSFDEFTDATDLEATMTNVWNLCAKGTGSSLMPKLLVSGADTQALFEGSQIANQRYVNTDDMKSGFKSLAFKSANYVFSPRGGESIYFLNPKSYQIIASKEYFRAKGKEMELEAIAGYKANMYSALQVVTNNRSRLGVCFT